MKDNYENLGELVEANSKLYKDHINNGGDPIKIILTLLPWDEAGLKWEVGGAIPDKVKELSLPAIIQFTNLIKEQIMEAIAPPGMPFDKTSMGREGGGGG